MAIDNSRFNSALYQIIGKRIRKLRRQKNITQDKISELTGISRSSLSNIESGKHQCSLHNLYVIFNALEEPLQLHLPTYMEVVDNLNSVVIYTHLIDDLSKKGIDEKSMKSIQDIINKTKHDH